MQQWKHYWIAIANKNIFRQSPSPPKKKEGTQIIDYFLFKPLYLESLCIECTGFVPLEKASMIVYHFYFLLRIL